MFNTFLAAAGGLTPPEKAVEPAGIFVLIALLIISFFIIGTFAYLLINHIKSRKNNDQSDE